MKTALAFLRRDLQIATSYKLAFGFQLVSIFFAVPLFHFVGKLFGATSSDFLEPYHGDYFAFLLIGMALHDYMSVSIDAFGRSLRESQMIGTLEVILMSPTSLGQMLIYSSLFYYLITTIRFSLYLIVGMFLGLDLANANLIGALTILGLGVASFIPFGIFTACVIMVFKRGNGVSNALSKITLFFGGVIYPTAVLPDWLRPLSYCLPLTWAADGMRQALLGGKTLAELSHYYLVLIAFAVILMPISLWCFRASVNYTKQTGSLSHF